MSDQKTKVVRRSRQEIKAERTLSELEKLNLKIVETQDALAAMQEEAKLLQKLADLYSGK